MTFPPMPCETVYRTNARLEVVATPRRAWWRRAWTRSRRRVVVELTRRDRDPVAAWYFAKLRDELREDEARALAPLQVGTGTLARTETMWW